MIKQILVTRNFLLSVLENYQNIMEEFKKFWFSQETLDIIANKGFDTPSSIQEKSFPVLMNTSKDLVWQSQTWTGKTAAFWVPMIEKISSKSKEKGIKAVVLCPSRELAIQVSEEINSFIGKKNINVFAIYWGQSYIKEKKAIKNWIDILVGTPWRIIDHLSNGIIDFSSVQYFVLDEADEMLNMWFIDDIEKILETTPESKRTILFSATIPESIMNIVDNYMKDYETIKVKAKTMTSDTVYQYYYMIKREEKTELLYRILDLETDFYWIVFCRTKSDVDELTKNLKNRWYNADCIHWDISQKQREKVINNFKNQNLKVLIATDVAARWLDVKQLSHVVNFSIPENTEDYTHRIWRTGRAWKSWTAITFVEPQQLSYIKSIQKKIKTTIKECDIPTVDYIVNKQKERLQERVGEAIDNHEYEDNRNLAKDLLELDEPEVVISSLIELTFKEKISKSKYGKISKIISKNNQEENHEDARLFVALGKNNDMWKKEILEYISNGSWVPVEDINDMKLMNDFSFVTVVQEDAKKIIKSFYKEGKWWKPLVSKAKKKK